ANAATGTSAATKKTVRPSALVSGTTSRDAIANVASIQSIRPPQIVDVGHVRVDFRARTPILRERRTPQCEVDEYASKIGRVLDAMGGDGGTATDLECEIARRECREGVLVGHIVAAVERRVGLHSLPEAHDQDSLRVGAHRALDELLAGPLYDRANASGCCPRGVLRGNLDLGRRQPRVQRRSRRLVLDPGSREPGGDLFESV